MFSTKTSPTEREREKESERDDGWKGDDEYMFFLQFGENMFGSYFTPI